jgi:hypothetical protein
MLKHYLTQARASDRNVEARLEREPFDYREYCKSGLRGAPFVDLRGSKVCSSIAAKAGRPKSHRE